MTNIYVVPGELIGIGTETIEATTTVAALTSATYAPTGVVANLVGISVIDDGAIYWVIQNEAGTLPANAANGMRHHRDDGVLFLSCDPSKLKIIRAPAEASDVTVNLHYFQV